MDGIEVRVQGRCLDAHDMTSFTPVLSASLSFLFLIIGSLLYMVLRKGFKALWVRPNHCTLI